MNWAAVSAVISAVTLLLVLVGGGVLWGALTEKVAGHTERLDSHKAEIGVIDGRLNVHDVEIAKLVEWKNGYNAAALVGRHTPEVS
jgi:hypothetical protein